MLIYNVLIIVLFIFSACCFYVKNNKVMVNEYGISIRYADMESVLLSLYTVIIIGISTFRDENVGIDMVNYIPRYEIIGNIDWTNLGLYSSSLGFEVGFLYINKIIYTIFNGSTTWYLFITSFIFIFGTYLLIKEYSVAPLLSMTVFVCYGIWGNSMNIIRQSMVEGLLCLALYFFEQKKYWLGISFFLCGIFNHSIAILFLPVFVLENIQLNKRVIFFIYLILLLSMLMPSDMVNAIIGTTSYAKYIGRQGSGLTTLIVLFIISIIATWNRRIIRNFDSKIDVWLVKLYSALLFNIFALHNGLFARVMHIYILCLLFIIPDMVFIFTKSVRFMVYSAFTILLIIYFYTIVMISFESSGGIIPYSSSILGI